MVPRRAEVRFDCAGAAFSRVRASARVELSGHFWAPKMRLLGSFWEPVGGLFAISEAVGSRTWFRSVKVSETSGTQPEIGSDQCQDLCKAVRI